MQLSSAAASRAPRLKPASLDARGVLTAGVLILVTIAISALSAGEFLKILLVFGAVFLCLWLLLSERYELTLAVLVLYLGLLDGYIKLKLNTSWATLGRDALLYAIVAGALIRTAVRRRSIELPPLSGWVLAFAGVVLIQVFNPVVGSWSHAIASVRPHLEFVPLFFLGYWTMRSKTRLRGFLLILLLAAAVNGVVSFIQFNLTPDQFASWGPGYSKLIFGSGDISARSFLSGGALHTRPFGLGGDSGFGGVVGMLAVPAALALVLTRARARPLFLSLILVLAAAVGVGVITSQARFVLISSVLAAIVFGVLASVSRRVIATFVALAVAFLVTLLTVSIVTGNSQTPFRKYKTITPDRVLTTTYEYRRATFAQIPKYVTKFPLGAGIGSVGPAGGYGSAPTRGYDLNAESEPTFLLIELGIPGLLVLLVLNLKLLALALLRIHRLPDIELRLVLAALVAPLFALFAGWIVGITTASSPAAPYFWFVAGITAYWLARDPRQSQAPSVTSPSLRPRSPKRRPQPTRGLGGRDGVPRPRPRLPGRVLPAPPRAPRARMNVLVLYRDRGVPVDGIRDYSHQLASSLSSCGVDVSLELMDGRELPPETARADSVIVQYNPFSYGRRGFAPWLPAELRKLKRVRPRPVIAVMVHEAYFPLWGWRGALMGGWQRFQLARVRRAADVTFVSIEKWLGSVSRWGPEGPIYHVPVGSNLPDMRSHRMAARAELGASEETIVLAAFGTNHPSRLPGHVGAAARALDKAGHSVVLLNLGDDAPVPEDVPASVRVEAPGRLDLSEIARRLSAADVFVSALVDGVSARRGTFIAALQHALPVVGTDGPLTDEFLQDATGSCRLVPVEDPELFAAAVVELAGRPAERERLAQGARLLYDNRFAWPVIADRVLTHVREVFLADLRDGARS
jgi:glycosyltransferase involved in cell wall biosynthesis